MKKHLSGARYANQMPSTSTATPPVMTPPTVQQFYGFMPQMPTEMSDEPSSDPFSAPQDPFTVGRNVLYGLRNNVDSLQTPQQPEEVTQQPAPVH